MVFISSWQLITVLDGLVLLAKCLWHRLRLYQEHAGCQMPLQGVRVDSYGKREGVRGRLQKEVKAREAATQKRQDGH